MRDTFLLGLVQNVAILLSFSMLYDYFWTGKKRNNQIYYKIIAGIFSGIISVVLILTPWTFREGLFFDTRSILLSVTGLFMGVIPAIVSMIVTTLYRIYIGGVGMWMGVGVIISSGMVGICWRFIRPEWQKSPVINLLLMGFVVHIFMLLCTAFLPSDLFFLTLEKIALPVLLVYPLSTLLLGLLMKRQAEAKEIKEALDNSEKRWRFALEGAGDGLWDWNVVTNNVYFSKQWKDMFGYEESEIKNHLDEWKRLVYPDDLCFIQPLIDNLLNGSTDVFEAEYRVICKDGSLKWILDRGKTIERDENGKAIRCIGTHKDITLTKSNEDALRQITQYTESILQTIPSFIFILDSSFVFLEVKSDINREYYASVDDFIGKTIYEVLPGDVALSAQECLSAVIRTGKMQKFEYVLKEKQGLKNYECTIVPFVDGKFIALINEITQRVKFEESLKDSKEKLKGFAAHLQVVREEERKFLAQEIHDELGQILIALKIDMGLLGMKIKRHIVSEDDVQHIFPELERINAFVEKAINTSRKIMSELHSEVLDLLGLEEAIVLQLNKFEVKTNINPVFNCNVKKLLFEKERIIALYRIFQEALNNISLHSKATEVSVDLNRINKNIVLTIKDNGIGFDQKKEKSIRSYGLMGMYERALFLDGELEIESSPGVGTTVTLSVPEKSE